MYFVTKASDDYWFDFTTESNIENLYKKYNSIVISKNYNYKEDPNEILEYWHDITLDTAKAITECELEITIYDDYLE